MATIGSAILCFATGYVLVALVIGELHSQPDLMFRICLAVGLGEGLFSIVYFLARWSGFMALWRIDFAISPYSSPRTYFLERAGETLFCRLPLVDPRHADS